MNIDIQIEGKVPEKLIPLDSYILFYQKADEDQVSLIQGINGPGESLETARAIAKQGDFPLFAITLRELLQRLGV